MAALVEAFCIQNLPHTSIEFLLAHATEYGINVPDDKKNDKPYVLKVVLRYLTSETVENSADHGAAVFLKLYGELGEELKTIGLQAIKPEPTPDPDGDRTIESLSYHKLRQFKINGTIGDPGQKNCLSYSSLCFQISQGETQGYSIKEVYAGVIRAIEPGNPFRDVLELEAEDFDKDAFMKSLRSHFKERDPNAVFNELRVCTQLPNETAHKFCCRCVALKKKIQNMAKTENIPFDEDNLSATFFRTIYTGLRQNNIRNELRAVLKLGEMADEDLLVEVSQASSNEEERLKKLNQNKTVNVNKLTHDSDSDESFQAAESDSSSGFSSKSGQNSQNKSNASNHKQAKAKKKADSQQSSDNNNKSDTNVLSNAEMNKMTAAFEKMTASNAQLTAEVNVLKKMTESHKPKSPHALFANPTANQGVGNIATASPGNSTLNPLAGNFQRQNQNQAMNRNRSRPFFKCQSCAAMNSFYCSHCFKCGGSDHKVKDCPLN